MGGGKGGAMCFPPLLGLMFRAVMSSNQEISDSDIFLELSVMVMKYSFKLNNSEPLSKKSPKQITVNLSWGRGGSGWGDQGHPQGGLNT